jgi:putative hydrolase of HD superfamily
MKRDVELLYEIGCLRFMPRLWKRFLNADFANVTEHTYRVVWTSLMLAAHEKKVNYEKLVKMALVHDVPESRTGDVDYISRQYATRDEERAVKDIFEGTVLEKEMVGLWREVEAKQTLEAKIVKDADTLDVELELMEQSARGMEITDVLTENRQRQVRKKLFTEAAKKYWEEIYWSNPHDWHSNSSGNRFNSGDWKK